ncbi:DnaA ATPase domain-containing protein [Methylomonas methanica]|uniref:Chromosomal replication initiator protein DnaA ATPAse domain-containing protein n=1 Tax=Methylomonas methanica TaxID=421 RepID=A0A177LTN2_METMH|nr:DnaA/Hda family protein [Methylomonas methanica]OAH96329.1 hypothetical protein A1332_23020 [Methylomonas methanica]
MNKLSICPISNYSDFLSSDYDFGSFVEAQANRFAKAACIDVSKNGVRSYNPLLIYGGIGLGKTHLLKGIAKAASLQRQDVSIVYQSAEQFVHNWVDAIRSDSEDKLIEYFESVDLWLVDNIELLTHKKPVWEGFLNILEYISQDKLQIVLAGAISIDELQELDEWLKSRFINSLSVEISQPDQDTRIEILRGKAMSADFELDVDIASLLA